MKRIARAIWIGSIKDGSGHITTQSAALNKAEYSWSSRFSENGLGTNPEELLGAAHAGCFTMKLCSLLGEAGFQPISIETTATINMEEGAYEESHLDVKAKVPGITDALFQRCANEAKDGCPVSKALNVKISMHCRLE